MLDADHVHCLVGAERAARGLREPVAGEDESGLRLEDMLSDPCAEDAYQRRAAPCAAQIARQRWPGCRIRWASAGPLDPAR